MKYLTKALKEKLNGSLGLSYVIEGAEGHNREKKEDGSFEDNNVKLIVANIIPQNDLISINFQACGSERDEITMSGGELRALAKEFLEWANIVDETL